MGIMYHHAIVVTSSDEKLLDDAYEAASLVFSWVSPVSPQAVNGYRSFFIPPDGFKEGWQPSDEGDQRRQEFIDWMNTQTYSDGSSGLSWVEVGFGEYGYEVENNDHDYYLERQAIADAEKNAH